MSATSPNVSRFALMIPGVSEISTVNAPFTVLSFRSMVNPRWTDTIDQHVPFYWANRCGQHGLSEHYLFETEVQANAFIEPHRLLAQPAILQCDDIFFHGYLSTVTCLPTAPSGHRYRFILSSPLYPLTQRATPKVFIDKTVPDIIEECLSIYGWQKGQISDYHFNLQDDYPPLSCWIQQAESDWDHLQRLLRRHGLFFYFVQTLERVTVIFSDHLNNKPLSVSFNQADQSLFSLQSVGQVLRGTTVFSAYNPESPSEPWIANQPSKKIGSAQYGTLHTHCMGADSEAQNAKLALIRQQSLDWQRVVSVASTTLSGLQPGQALCLSGHPIPHFNQTYTIIDIEHHGNQSAAYLGNDRAKKEAEQETKLSYKNHLNLIPHGLPFRKYDGYAPLIQAPLRGTLESADAEAANAAIDETGHYRFRYPFDTSDKNPIGMASPKTRFTQFMGSAGDGLAGMYFPNQPGTEVELVFLQGNINCPVIVGALSTPAVVNQDNSYEARVRTAQGHEWCIDDTPDKEVIRLSTPEQKEILELKANTTEIGITLKTVQGALNIQAAQGIQWETNETLSIQTTDYDLLIRENYSVDAGARIDWETGGHFFLKAAFIQFTGSELSINSAQNMVMQTASLHCAAPESSDNSTLTVCADNTLCIESADIQLRAHDTLTLENAGAKIVFENGHITLTSPTEIEFIGDSVQFIGTQQRG